MKRSIIYLLFVLLFTSCGNNHTMTEKVINTYDNGQPAKVYQYDQNGQCVREVDYYDSGAIWIEGPVKNDLRNGEWTSYFPDGKVQSTGVYKDGLRIGKAQIFHENGRLWMDGYYKDDERCGEWVFYDEQGYEIERRDYGSCD